MHGRRSRGDKSPRIWSGGIVPQILSCCKILSTRLLAFQYRKMCFCLYSRTFIVSPAMRPPRIPVRSTPMVECRRSCGQQYKQVRPRLVATFTHRSTLSHQSRSRSSSASWCSTVCTTEHPSTTSTSASLSPVSPPDNIFALPAEVFSSCLAIVSAVMVDGLFLLPALRYGTGYQTV